MSKTERLRQLSGLREEAGLDALVLTTPSNLHYFSGFRTTLYTRFNGLVVTDRSDPILITSYVDEQLAKKEIWGPVWVRDIRIYGPIQRPDVVPLYLDALAPALRGARRLGVDAITLSLAREIEAVIPGISLVDVSPRLAEIRLQKEPDEIDKIRRASEIAVTCLEAARDILGRVGVTELDLGAELEFQARRMGADGWGYPILISAGEKIAAPHAPPLPIPIPIDVPFLRIGFAPTYDGYTTSIIRTYCREPNGLTMRYETAFFDAMAALKATLRPGVSVQDILGTVGACYERHGVRSAWGGDMGYSLGVAVQEPPRIGGTDTTPMKANTTLALMPGLRTAGEATFHHSDVYVVHGSGCDLLCDRLQGVVAYG
jgi:Xaa-Pro dipeptidase